MMNRLSYWLLFILLVVVSCTREGDLSQEWDGPVIEVSLNLEEDFQTKADEVYEQAGENVFHENEIKWVDFYFYPDGKTTEQASYHIRKTLDQLTRNSATFRLELTPNQVNYQIFPTASNTTETLVFALANVDQTLLDGQDDMSMTHLKSLLVTTDFEAAHQQENHRQQQFMMSGEGLLKLKQPGGRTQKEVAEPLTIDLSRYACKLTVSIKTEASVPIMTKRKDDDGNPIYETWTPCVEEMKVYIDKAVKTVSLGGEPRRASDPGTQELSYRSNPLLFFHSLNPGEANPNYELLFDQSPGGYYNTYPTYMYPQKWEDGSEDEPFIKLVLPWVRSGDAHGLGELKKEFYYKILIPRDRRGGEYANTFTRNNWYHYNIDVGILGADTDDADVLLDPIDCYIYYWQDKNVVVKHADIGNARYLSVAEEEYILYNEPELDIRFTTSHPVTYEILSATRPYYGQETSGKAHGGIICQAQEGDALYSAGSYYLKYDETSEIKPENWFSLDGGALKMNHPLENNYTSPNFDYSPYTISLTIFHKDKGAGSDFSKTVTITQNPAIYITAELNSDPKTAPLGRTEPYEDDEDNSEKKYGRPVWKNYKHSGYVFIDGQRLMRHRTDRNDDGEYGTMAKHLKSDWSGGTRSAGVADRLEWLQWRTVNFTGGNRNRYTIHVSVLPDDSSYIIGDPRTMTPETWNNGLESESPITHEKYYYWNKDTGEENQEYSIQFEQALHVSNYTEPGTSKDTLTYYYPTEESDRTKNMLAPAFMVSSRFGGVEFYNGFTQQSGRFKCATYQEDGYPAGRWRLPTKAEIDFIATLTQKGGFVQLFSTGNSARYWSANGAVQPLSGLKNDSYAMVRCVYDTWYWDAYDDRLPAEDRDIYVFGDYER